MTIAAAMNITRSEADAKEPLPADSSSIDVVIPSAFPIDYAKKTGTIRYSLTLSGPSVCEVVIRIESVN